MPSSSSWPASSPSLLEQEGICSAYNQRKVKAAGVARQIEESPLLDSLFGESVESEVEARFDFGGKNDNQHLYPVCTPDLEGKVKDRFESKQAIYQ